MDYEILRVCSKCRAEKPLEDFPNDKAKRHGKSYKCKNCKAEYAKEYWQREDVKQRECIRRKSVIKYIEKRRVRQLKYQKENRFKYKPTVEYYAVRGVIRKARRQTDPKYQLHEAISARMRHCLKKNKAGRALNEILCNVLGYDLTKLQKHLYAQFKPGMTWENYGEWHVDHKIPVAVFNFQTVDDVDFRKCWALKNLQPLWKKENMQKQDKIKGPFQPSLLL